MLSDEQLPSLTSEELARVQATIDAGTAWASVDAGRFAMKLSDAGKCRKAPGVLAKWREPDDRYRAIYSESEFNALVTIADGFDLTGPAAEVVLAAMAWSARMERLAINERISDARVRLAAENRPWGRPPGLGPQELERVRQLRASGRSVRQVAVAMKLPLATIARACRKVAA